MPLNRCRQMTSAAYRKGFFALLSANFLTQFLSFGTTLLVAKFLSPAELGDIRILQAYSLLFVIIGGFGYNTATLKFCSELNDERWKQGLLTLAVRRSVVSSLLVLAIVGLLAASGKLTRSPELGRWLVFYGATIPLAVFTQLLMSYLQALKRISEMARLQAMLRIQSFLVIVASTWAWGFAGFVISTLVSSGLGLLPLVWQVGRGAWNVCPASLPRGFDRMAFFSMLGNGVVALGSFGQFYLLDHLWQDRQEIGYYSLATIFLLAASQVTFTVQTIATPYLSERSSDPRWFVRTLIRVQLQMAVVAIGIAAAVLMGAWFLVRVFYGPAYMISLTYLVILLVKYVLWSCGALVGVAMLALGKVHLNFLIAAIATSIGLGLSYGMLQRFGLIGLAWAQVVADAVALTLMLLNGWRVVRGMATSLESSVWPAAPHAVAPNDSRHAKECCV